MGKLSRLDDLVGEHAQALREGKQHSDASGGIREILMNYPSLYQAVLAGFAYQRHLREEAEKEAEGGDE